MSGSRASIDNHTLMEYTYSVEFIETPHFSGHLPNYLSEEEYWEFQSYLLKHPDAGKVIRATGGLRKIRWKAKGKGKRGGVRIIYYWYSRKEQIYLLTIYTKNEMTDLTTSEKKGLSKLVEGLKND